MTTTFFWDFTHWRMVVCYWCCTTYWTPCHLKIRPISCPIMHTTNYHSMLCKITEQCISHPLPTDYRLLSITWLSHVQSLVYIYIYIFDRRREINNIKQWHAECVSYLKEGKWCSKEQENWRKLRLTRHVACKQITIIYEVLKVPTTRTWGHVT
jgi:hypothetical protein